MKRNVLLIAFTVLLMLLAAVSCSVKENREPCPCYIVFTFPDRDIVSHGVGIGAWHSKFLFSDNIDLGDYPVKYMKAVERQELVVYAYTGKNVALREERRMMIPYGSQSDSLYSFYQPIDCNDELSSCEVKFHKQFATVTVDIRKSVSQMSHYELEASGNTCGFDVLSYVPVIGPFSCKVAPIQNDYVFRFRIPRQIDNSMSITLFKDGKQTGVYPLGRLIERMGYDWLEDDLRDIFVSIDYTVSNMSVYVEGWEIVEDFPLKDVVL